MKDWTLDSILAPLPSEDFLSKVLGRDAVYVGGYRDKFRDLLSWATVSNILTYSGLDAPRLRIEKSGEEIPSNSFCQPGLNGFPRIGVEAIYQILREGATLIVDGMEGLSWPVARLCEAIERGVEVPAQVRFCACWGDGSEERTRGNDHDVFVLQLTGTRVWTVQSHFGPLPWELNVGCISSRPAKQHLMEPGDVLYLPRGCSHADSVGSAVASFLVVSFRNPTGLQLLGRVFDGLRSSPALNTDFPRFADDGTQMRYLTFLQSEAIRAMNEPGLLLGFMKDLWAISEPRTRVSLPWGASAEVLPLSGNDVVILSARFPNVDTLVHTPGSAAVEVVHERRKRVLDDIGRRILIALLTRQELTVDELAAETKLSSEELLTGVSDMIKSGLLLLRQYAREAVPYVVAPLLAGGGEERRGDVLQEIRKCSD